MGVITDPETSSLGLAALRHHARTQTAAKHGSAVNRCLVFLFPVCVWDYSFGFGLVSFFVWTTRFASWGSAIFLCGVVPSSTMPFCLFLVASRIFRWRHGLNHFSRNSRTCTRQRPHRRYGAPSTFWPASCCVTCGFAQTGRLPTGGTRRPVGGW